MRCHHCGKLGHIKRNCRELSGEKLSQKEKRSSNYKANKSSTKRQDCTGSDSESAGLVVSHALSASSSCERKTGIVDSGATCHMCHDRKLFTALHHLKDPLEVVLGDGHALMAAEKGDVLKATQRGKMTKFTKVACYILDKEHTLIAKASKVGSLYHLDHQPYHEQANPAKSSEMKEDIWHRRFGHLGACNLQRARENLVDGFDYDQSKELTFCEPCVEGKQHRSKFPSNGRRRAEGPLDLVHSDL